MPQELDKDLHGNRLPPVFRRPPLARYNEVVRQIRWVQFFDAKECPMRIEPRYFFLGLCLSLIGASPAREKASSGWSDSLAATSTSLRALTVEEDGRLSVQAAGRHFEFGEGGFAVFAQ